MASLNDLYLKYLSDPTLIYKAGLVANHFDSKKRFLDIKNAPAQSSGSIHGMFSR